MQNHWFVEQDFDYAGWSLDFDDVQLDVNDLLQLMHNVVDLCDQLELAIVNKAISQPFFGDYPNFVRRDGYTYADYAEDMVEQHGLLPLFDLSHRASPGNQTTSKACFYNTAGELDTINTDNLGALLRSLRPDLVAQYDIRELNRHMYERAPLQFSGDTLLIREGAISKQHFRLHLYTSSDIWFPKVYGIGEKDGKALERRRLNQPFDNSEIAQCHTPRLNALVPAFKELGLKLGAKWLPDIDSFPEDSIIRRRLTPDGILLV